MRKKVQKRKIVCSRKAKENEVRSGKGQWQEKAPKKQPGKVMMDGCRGVGSINGSWIGSCS